MIYIPREKERSSPTEYYLSADPSQNHVHVGKERMHHHPSGECHPANGNHITPPHVTDADIKPCVCAISSRELTSIRPMWGVVPLCIGESPTYPLHPGKTKGGRKSSRCASQLLSKEEPHPALQIQKWAYKNTC